MTGTAGSDPAVPSSSSGASGDGADAALFARMMDAHQEAGDAPKAPPAAKSAIVNEATATAKAGAAAIVNGTPGQETPPDAVTDPAADARAVDAVTAAVLDLLASTNEAAATDAPEPAETDAATSNPIAIALARVKNSEVLRRMIASLLEHSMGDEKHTIEISGEGRTGRFLRGYFATDIQIADDDPRAIKDQDDDEMAEIVAALTAQLIAAEVKKDSAKDQTDKATAQSSGEKKDPDPAAAAIDVTSTSANVAPGPPPPATPTPPADGANPSAAVSKLSGTVPVDPVAAEAPVPPVIVDAPAPNSADASTDDATKSTSAVNSSEAPAAIVEAPVVDARVASRSDDEPKSAAVEAPTPARTPNPKIMPPASDTVRPPARPHRGAVQAAVASLNDEKLRQLVQRALARPAASVSSPARPVADDTAKSSAAPSAVASEIAREIVHAIRTQATKDAHPQDSAANDIPQPETTEPAAPRPAPAADAAPADTPITVATRVVVARESREVPVTAMSVTDFAPRLRAAAIALPVTAAAQTRALTESETGSGSGGQQGFGRGHESASAVSKRLAQTVETVTAFDAMITAPSTFTDTVPALDASSAPNIPNAPAVMNSIVQSMRMQHQDGVSTATIALDPGFLGGVAISIHVVNGAVTATVQADNPQVRAWLEANESALRQGLETHGLTLERLVVREEAPPEDKASPDERRRQQQSPLEDKPRRRRQETATFEVIV